MHKNRSPCPPALLLSLIAAQIAGPITLRESAPPPVKELRETREPSRSQFTLREETRGDKTVTLVDITVATAGKVNRNGRLYPRAVWQKAVEMAQDRLPEGKLWGLLEHPEGWYDPLTGRLENICLRYETLTMDGDLVKATAVLIDTESGAVLKALLSGGIAVGVSSNGTGSQKWLPAREVAPDYPDPDAYIAVIQDDFRLLTIDVVSDPSDVSGTARQRERRLRPCPPTPQEGQNMNWNQKVKRAAERLGMSLEAFVANHKEWAEELQQEGTAAAPEAAPVAPAPATPSPAQTEAAAPAAAAAQTPAPSRALEEAVIGLQGDLARERKERQDAERDALVAAALEAARLPSAGILEHGGQKIDLDAGFRSDLIAAARAAQTSESAQTDIDLRIAQRRALLARQEAAKPATGAPTPAPVLHGDNSRTPSGDEAAQKTEFRQLESARSKIGLIR